MTTTLHDFFTAAQLKYPVSFAPFITLKNQPWHTQVKDLNKLLTHDRWGLFGQPATGKTLAAQAAMLYWISEGQKCVALMPPTLLYQFQEEFHRVFEGSEKYLRFHVYDQTPEKRKKLRAEWDAKGWPEVIAMSYQMYARSYPDLLAAGYRVLVCDEAQQLKDSNSGIYGQVKEFADQPGGAALILMTGTPIHNELVDAYALTSLINPGAYRSFKHWDTTHSNYMKIRLKEPRRMKNGKLMTSIRTRIGYRDLPKIRQNLYENATRTLKKDVFEIQDPSIIEVSVKLDPAHLALYKKLVRERILVKQEEVITATNQQSLRQKALQIVTCPELFVDELPFKNQVIATVDQLLQTVNLKETKVLIFVNFQNSVRAVAEHLKQHNPALMYGQSDSDKNRRKFLEDASCRILVAHPKSAGVGLNLQGVCHTVIFAEPTGVPGDFQQAMDRVVRFGQRNLVNVYILKAMGTIAPQATEAMLGKHDDAQQVNRDWYTFVDHFRAA